MATGRVPTTANSPLTAKGDLFGYSTTQARVAVGNDGETLVADSSTSTGLRYQGNFAAGKNKFINGDFGVWQRGTSFSTADAYTADRWVANSDASFTLSRQTFTPGTAPVAGYEGQFFARFAKSAGGNYGTGSMQKIEDVRTFAGQTVTLSFWAKADAAVTISPYYNQIFGSGGSATVGAAIGAGTTLTTSWARYSLTFALPSISGKTVGTSSHIELYVTRYIGSAATTIDLWGVQIEAGSVATAFQTATGTIQGELFACKYYFERRQGGTSFGSIPLFGQCISTTSVYIPIFYTPKRTTPTLTQGGTWKQYTASATANAATYSLVARSANDGYAVATTTGMVAGNASITEWDTSSYLDISSEL